MTLKQLEYFLAIAETGHISTAAQELGLSQPPISMQLHLLEEELGLELFCRDKRNLVITPAGKLLQKKAEQILQLTEAAGEEVQSLGKRMRGTVNIGVITSACVRVIPAKASELLREHPDVNFQLWEGTSGQIMDWLNNGTCDIGLIREPYNHDLFRNYPFWDTALGESQVDPFVAAGTPFFMNFAAGREEISLKELADKPLIFHRRYYQQLMAQFREENIYPTVICQNNDLLSSASWAAHGIGVALFPLTSSLLHLGNRNMIVVRISGQTLNTRMALISRKDRHLSPAAQMFVEILGKDAPQPASD